MATSERSRAAMADRVSQKLAELRACPAEPRKTALSPAALARTIDHTLLKPEATTEMIDTLCSEARTYGFASVCVNPCNVSRCADNLAGSDALVCSVVGFPLGATLASVKAFETLQAMDAGATEIDMVINVGALKDGDYDLVREDIAAVAKACHKREVICKVIIEAALLTDEEKVSACLLIADAGADYSKTSTGFGPGGATVEDVALMRAVAPTLGVKAAGGIRTYEAALAMIRAGATRIGASSGIAIVEGAPRKG